MKWGKVLETIRPRMLWVCPHLVLRYEEIPLFIEAGAEVIPSLGDSQWLPFDSHYDDEADFMYPNWRAYCTLPTNVVERIRSIRLDLPTIEEIEFMNQWLDIIYIASFPNLVEATVQWFKGTVLFRTFGGPDPGGYTRDSHTEGIDLSVFGNAHNYIWSPILKSLNDKEDNRLVRNSLYLPAFVSKERLPFTWAGRDSEKKASTLISSIHANDWANSLYLTFSKAFQDLDYLILGRNDKTSPRCTDPAILGNVNFKTLMSRLTRTRLFCYGGAQSPYHLHFTPIEAMVMKVPMLFLESCGITREAYEYGLDRRELLDLGMCQDYSVMVDQAKKIMEDFDYLNQLQNKQEQSLLPVFGRNRALSIAKDFIDGIRAIVTEKRVSMPAEYVYINSFDHNDISVSRNITRLKEMPTVPGEYRMISGKYVNGDIGRFIVDENNGYYARRAVKDIDLPGMLAKEYIYRMSTGEYKVSATIYLKEIGCFQPSGFFSFRILNPDFLHRELFITPITGEKQGMYTYNGIAVIDESMILLKKDLQLMWRGEGVMDLLEIRFEKLTDNTELTLQNMLNLNWTGGFSVLEMSNGETWRWCSDEGILEIHNTFPCEKIVRIASNVRTSEDSILLIESELWSEQINIGKEHGAVDQVVRIPPGKYEIKFMSNAQKLNTPHDPRELVFRLLDFHYDILS